MTDAPSREEAARLSLIDKVRPGWPLNKEDCISIVAALRLAAKSVEDGKDASPFEGLTALVQYRRKDVGFAWRNMAAFDSFGIAERYRDNMDAEAPWEYRAVDLSTTGAPNTLPLKELLNERDAFIVRKGLWSEFTDSLRQAPHSSDGKGAAK